MYLASFLVFPIFQIRSSGTCNDGLRAISRGECPLCVIT